MPDPRFTVSPATTHPADVDAARVAQCLVDNLPDHVADRARRASAQAPGGPAESVRAGEAVVREWLYSGGLEDLR